MSNVKLWKLPALLRVHASVKLKDFDLDATIKSLQEQGFDPVGNIFCMLTITVVGQDVEIEASKPDEN